jgi:hypothetical protein
VPAIKAGAKRVAPAGIAFPENARRFVSQYYVIASFLAMTVCLLAMLIFFLATNAKIKKITRKLNEFSGYRIMVLS